MMKNIMASTLVHLCAKIIKFLRHSEWISDKITEKSFTENTKWDKFLLELFILKIYFEAFEGKVIMRQYSYSKEIKE